MSTRPISVLHVIDSLALGGAERVLVELVNHLARPYIRSLVCVTRDSDMTLAARLRADVPVYQLKRRRTWDKRSLRQFAQIVQENQVQIIQAHGYSSSRFVLASRWLYRFKVPVIMHAHSCYPPDKVTSLMGYWGIDHFIGVSPQLLAWAHQLMRIHPERSTLLGNAISFEPYRTATPISRETWFSNPPRFLALIVANVLPVKDFYTVFKAMSLAQHKAEIGLLVAGSTADTGYRSQCQRWLEEMGLAEQVLFLDSRQDVPSLVASADAGLLSSRYESGPIVLLEYMAGGIPFVVTQVGQVAQTAADAGLQGLVPVGDVTTFAKALDELVTLPPADRKVRGEYGRALFQQKFSLESRLEKLQSLYQTLLG
jgi:glycosyltransferase involved in cell wall biosynthesis